MDTRRVTIRQIVFFLTINALMTAAVFAWMLSGGGDSMALVMLMMWTPAISAFVTLVVFREPLSSLGWRPGRVRYLIESYTLPIIVAIVAYGLVWMTGFAEVYVDAHRLRIRVVDGEGLALSGASVSVQPG